MVSFEETGEEKVCSLLRVIGEERFSKQLVENRFISYYKELKEKKNVATRRFVDCLRELNNESCGRSC